MSTKLAIFFNFLRKKRRENFCFLYYFFLFEKETKLVCYAVKISKEYRVIKCVLIYNYFICYAVERKINKKKKHV